MARLQLTAHPEGGFYRRTYESRARAGERPVCTAIYFLLPEGHVSRLHRLRSDEMWHFYEGGPLRVVEITEKGEMLETVLSTEHRQHVVPAGRWFGSKPVAGGEYALVGCTVAPGFDFADFEMGDRAALLREYPHAAEVITELT